MFPFVPQTQLVSPARYIHCQNHNLDKKTTIGIRTESVDGQGRNKVLKALNRYSEVNKPPNQQRTVHRVRKCPSLLD